MILNIMGKSGHEGIINEAKKRFQQHIKGELMDPNIRGAVYALTSRHGDEKTHEELRKLHNKAEMTEEKVRIIRALGQTLDPNLMEITLQFVFESVCICFEKYFTRSISQ